MMRHLDLLHITSCQPIALPVTIVFLLKCPEFIGENDAGSNNERSDFLVFFGAVFDFVFFDRLADASVFIDDCSCIGGYGGI